MKFEKGGTWKGPPILFLLISFLSFAWTIWGIAKAEGWLRLVLCCGCPLMFKSNP